MGEQPNLIMELTFAFSLKIVGYTEILEEKRRYNMANRLFKSGTSIGANVREAQHAESRKDFIHKMKIAAKEAEETHYWLSLCENAHNYPSAGTLLPEVESIQKVISKIISSTKGNLQGDEKPISTS